MPQHLMLHTRHDTWFLSIIQFLMLCRKLCLFFDETIRPETYIAYNYNYFLVNYAFIVLSSFPPKIFPLTLSCCSNKVCFFKNFIVCMRKFESNLYCLSFVVLLSLQHSYSYMSREINF